MSPHVSCQRLSKRGVVGDERVKGYGKEIETVMTAWVSNETAMTGAMEKSGCRRRVVHHSGTMLRSPGVAAAPMPVEALPAHSRATKASDREGLPVSHP